MLGDPLESAREGHRTFELRFEGAGAAADSLDAHGGGTLVVADDDEAAVAEYERCHGAGTLRCYRAANVAFYFGGTLAPADLARVELALRALAED